MSSVNMTGLKSWEREIISKFGSLYLRYSPEQRDIVKVYGRVPHCSLAGSEEWYVRHVKPDGDEDCLIIYSTIDLMTIFTPVNRVPTEKYELMPLCGQESLYFKDGMTGEIRRVPYEIGTRRTIKKVEWVAVNK